MRLDDRDIKILTILQQEGRITKQALAEQVALSHSACLERLQRLEKSGLIRGYRAEVVLEQITPCVAVYVEVTLARHQAADFATFEQAIAEVPEVVACDAIGGGIDYLMKVIALDIGHYQELMDSLLERDIGIGTYFTYIVTKSVKPLAPLPIRSLLARAKGED
ncbi:MAG: Lrp/AsnC family transcriptional regulator [Rhodovibrionaceae bacterium]